MITAVLYADTPLTHKMMRQLNSSLQNAESLPSEMVIVLSANMPTDT